MTLPTGERCDRYTSRKRSTTPQPPSVTEEKLLRPAHLPPEGAEPKFAQDAVEEKPRRRSSHSQSPVLGRSHSRPKVLVRILLVLSALTAVALLLFGGHERAEKIAVYREYLRQSKHWELPQDLIGHWQLLGSQENFSFVLQEIPISPMMLNDFHDPGDVQRLPFSGEADLDPQDIVPEKKRLSRFLMAEVPLKLPSTEALENLYLEAPQLTIEVSHPNGTRLLHHRFELLRKVEGAMHLPTSQLCYVLPPGPGPHGAEALGCEQTATLHAPRSELTQRGVFTMELILRSYADPNVVANHLTRGCTRMNSSLCSQGADACSANVTGAPFSAGRPPWSGERCFGRPRRLFRVYGLALLGLCSMMAAASEAILSRGSWQHVRVSAFTIFGLISSAAALRLLSQG